MVHKSSASSATGAKEAEKALLSLKALVFSAYSLWALLTDDGFRENVSATAERERRIWLASGQLKSR